MSAQMRQEFAGLSPEQQAMLEALTAQTQEQARAARDPLGLAGQSPLLFGPEAAMLDLQSLGLNPPGPMPGAPAAPTAPAATRLRVFFAAVAARSRSAIDGPF